jgi:hypothetical protein
MIQSTKKIRRGMAYRCVFQHHAVDIENATETINEMVLRCLSTNQAIIKADFDSKLKLYYGYYNSRDGVSPQSSLRALIWKHSELTGKYCGCQYWSVGAKSAFEETLRERMNGKGPNLEDAWSVAKSLQKTDVNSYLRLVHEHVFPMSRLIETLRNQNETLSRDWVDREIKLRAVGCVILASEDKVLSELGARTKGNEDNLWLRYKDARIRLVDNPDWPELHRELIKEAELI